MAFQKRSVALRTERFNRDLPLSKDPISESDEEDQDQSEKEEEEQEEEHS